MYVETFGPEGEDDPAEVMSTVRPKPKQKPKAKVPGPAKATGPRRVRIACRRNKRI